MQKEKQEQAQLCLFKPSYEELLSWDGMNAMTPYRLTRLLNKFSIEKVMKERKK
jgi:hypothetical protein